MLPGKYDFTIVQGKTLRRAFKLTDAAGEPFPVANYEFRAKFKKDADGPDILYLSTNIALPGLTEDSAINILDEDTIELYVPDEIMEDVLHTQWFERDFGGVKKYSGVWELEAEDDTSPNDTVPLLMGKVKFIREIAR